DLHAARVVQVAVLQAQIAVAVADAPVRDAPQQAVTVLEQKLELPGLELRESALVEEAAGALPRLLEVLLHVACDHLRRPVACGLDVAARPGVKARDVLGELAHVAPAQPP